MEDGKFILVDELDASDKQSCSDSQLPKVETDALDNSNDSSKENATPREKYTETRNSDMQFYEKKISSNETLETSEMVVPKEEGKCLKIEDQDYNGTYFCQAFREDDLSKKSGEDHTTESEIIIETKDTTKFCAPDQANQQFGKNVLESTAQAKAVSVEIVKQKCIPEYENENIKSVEKMTDDNGDEFIITMNDSDESEEEVVPNLKFHSVSESAQVGGPNTGVKPDLGNVKYCSSLKEKSITNPQIVRNANVNLPPLPPLPQVINQLPLLLPSPNTPSTKSIPLVNLYIPSSLVNGSTAITSNKQVKTSNVSLIPAIRDIQSTHNADFMQRLNTVKQLPNSRSLLNSTQPVSKSQVTTILDRQTAVAFPQSSREMISLIRWETANRVYHRPKFQHLQPDSELGPLAKFLFDLGNDLVRETVYNDLVRIQTYRKTAGKLSEKESDDLNKLKDVQTELKDLVGPIKQNSKYRCDCGFKSESSNVLSNHQEFPHVMSNYLNCAVCQDYSTRQPTAFIQHLETMHNVRARFDDKQPFWTCNLCPYENNSKSKLAQHRVRCLKNFNLKTNLSPNSIVGMEINFSLENILYKKREVIKAKVATTYAPAVNLRPQLNIAPKPRPNTYQNNSVKNFNNSSAPAYSNGPHANLSSKINILIDKNNQVLSQARTQSENAGFEVCEICGGYVKDRKALRIHFYYAHRIEIPIGVFDRTQAPLYCATCFARFWTAQGLQKHLEVHKINSQGNSAAKCIVCGHKVPNVLMHMRIVHNKELNSYLKALKCIFCGLVCSSKRGLENHMVAGHGVLVKTDNLIGQSVPKTVRSKLETSRGSMCVLCNLHFSRNVDLTRHCMRIHHTCMKCGMVVADKISLDKHTCLKSGRGLRDCELCCERGFHPAYHVKHIRDKHIKKCTVDIVRMSSSLLHSAYSRINIQNPRYSSDLKRCNAVQTKWMRTKPVEMIEIISDDENSPQKTWHGKKRTFEDVEFIDGDDLENREEMDRTDEAYVPPKTKKKGVEKNILKGIQKEAIVRPTRRSSSLFGIKNFTAKSENNDSSMSFDSKCNVVNTNVVSCNTFNTSTKRMSDPIDDQPVTKKGKLNFNTEKLKVE